MRASLVAVLLVLAVGSGCNPAARLAALHASPSPCIQLTASICGPPSGYLLRVVNHTEAVAIVEPWAGAHRSAIAPGADKVVSTQGHPPLPWHVVVYGSGGSELGTHTWTVKSVVFTVTVATGSVLFCPGDCAGA